MKPVNDFSEEFIEFEEERWEQTPVGMALAYLWRAKEDKRRFRYGKLVINFDLDDEYLEIPAHARVDAERTFRYQFIF
jgi:hypothetical protein